MHGIVPRLRRRSLLLAAAFTLVIGAPTSSAAQRTAEPTTTFVAQPSYSHFLSKIRLGKTVKVAFFGGSQTAGSTTLPRVDPNGAYDYSFYERERDSWRAQVMQGLRSTFQRFPKQIQMVNAALSGTGSMAGAFRYESDVASHNPDLLIIEFSVNDRPLANLSTTPTADCSIQRTLLSIVEQARAKNPNIAILMSISPTRLMINQPTSTAAMARAMTKDAAISFGIPYVDISEHFFLQPLPSGILISELFSGDPTQFGNDVHPAPIGHTIYAQSVLNALSGVFRLRGFHFPVARIPMPTNLEPFPKTPVEYKPADMPLLEGFQQDTNKEDWVRHPLFTGKDAMFTMETKTEFIFDFQGSAAAIWWEWQYGDERIHGKFELILDGVSLGVFSSDPDPLLGEQRLPNFQVVGESLDSTVPHTMRIRVPQDQPGTDPNKLNLAMIGLYVDEG